MFDHRTDISGVEVSKKAQLSFIGIVAILNIFIKYCYFYEAAHC